MRRAAILVSAVFHPLFMPLAAVYIATQYDWYVHGRLWPERVRLVYLIVALSTIAFPAINILLLRWHGAVTSLESPPKSERLVPFLSTVFFFAMGYYLLSKARLPYMIYSIFLGYIAMGIALMALNFYFKISVHVAGVFGVLGVVLAILFVDRFNQVNLLVAVVVAAALVMSARLVLRVHTPAEAYAGAAVGFACTFAAVYFGWRI